MLSKFKTGFRRPYSKVFFAREVPKISTLLPRLWMILLVLAPPFFSIAADYFESLERTGPVASFFADTLFSAMLGAYIILLLVLKQRRI